ncbi:putative Magnetosome protein MamS [Gammaproteobacteria bacterium]
MTRKRLVVDGMSIVAGGMLLLMVVGLVALLFPNGFSLVPATDQSMPATQMTTQIAPVTPVRMIPIATVQPTPRVAGKGLKPLGETPQVKFQGTVQQITEQPQSDGQLHVWLNSAGGETRVSVAPGWFLQYLGCQLLHDITISGVGFIFQPVAGTATGIGNDLIYAKKIVINGKTCQLRNDEGFALWSNKLR